MSARDDTAQTIAALERELHRLRCEYARVCKALDWAEEQVRVYQRVIVRQDQRIRTLERAIEHLA